MVKTTGAEWKRFYKDKDFWPEGWWHEDDEITVNGVSVYEADIDLSAVADADVLTVAGGIVLRGEYTDDGPTVEGHFKAWRKKQTTAFFTVEAPKEKAEVVRAAVVAAGGKVNG